MEDIVAVGQLGDKSVIYYYLYFEMTSKFCERNLKMAGNENMSRGATFSRSQDRLRAN